MFEHFEITIYSRLDNNMIREPLQNPGATEFASTLPSNHPAVYIPTMKYPGKKQRKLFRH